MNLKFLRRHATSIVLALLAALFGVILLVVDRGSVSTGEAEHRKRNLFDAWRADDITELDISAQGKSAHLVQSARDDAGPMAWVIELDGQRFPADEQAVDQLLGTLEFAVFERRLDPSSVDRAAFGLDNPTLSVRVQMGRQTYRLVVAGSAPTPPGAAYAEVEGRGVFVITGQLQSALNIAPERLRSKSIVPYFSTELSGIRLDGTGGPRHFIRAPWGGGGGGGFRFDGSTPEGQVRVNANAIDNLFTTLGRVQAEAFLSDAEADRMAKAEVTVTFIPRDSAAKPGILEIGGPCPGRDEHVIAIRREPSRASACIPKSALDELSTPAADFVDRTLLGAPLQEITEVSVIRADRKVELARKGTQWHQRAPAERDVEAAIGEGFIETLRKVNASRFLSDDPGTLGLSPPQATIRILSITPGAAPGGGDVERTELLEVGAEQGDEIVIRRVEDGAIAAVPRELAAPLLSGDLALRSRTIFKVPIQQFAALRIVEAHGRTQHVTRTKDGAWRLAEPQGSGLAADLGLASEVAEVLGALQAERWVAADAGRSYGLDTPRLVIEATLGRERGEEGSPEPAGDGGTPETIRIELGAPTADGSFARRDGDPAIFVAPKALEAAASRWLLDRAVFHMDPSEIVRATLSEGGGKRKLTVEHKDNLWRIQGAPDDAASNARAAALRDALGDLMAEGAVTVGKSPKQEGLDKPELTLEVERKKREPLKMVIGAGDSFRGTSIRYARRAGLDVTYAIAQSKVRPLLEAVQGLR